ncbi:MAG: hypothetical protein CL878_06405 [Dehalococcoidia bacterium]|nr:hypothetical protein [Dehalococcoidia bacterium]
MPIVDCHAHTQDWSGFASVVEHGDHWDRCLDWGEKLAFTYLRAACSLLAGAAAATRFRLSSRHDW